MEGRGGDRGMDGRGGGDGRRRACTGWESFETTQHDCLLGDWWVCWVEPVTWRSFERARTGSSTYGYKPRPP